MNWTDRWWLALRYTFAFGQGHLSAFLSSLSMLGLVLAITLLIIVLSVMNGFDKEMRERILALVPHITLYAEPPLENWQPYVDDLMSHPDVVGAGPFAQFDALVMRGTGIETVRGIGLDAGDRGTFAALVSYLDSGEARLFARQPNGLILGADVARSLNAGVGDSLSLVVPGTGQPGQMGPTRFQTVQLSAVLHTGTELDQAIALVHLPLASKLAGLDGRISGFRITTRNLFDVQRISQELHEKLPVGFYSTNWMMTHGNLYSAIQLSRDLISILLFSIIAVAAFNVVSSLVLVVLDKRGNIAILRTLGATGTDVAWVFVLQGAMIGLVGVTIGSTAGALGSLAVPDLISWLERVLEFRFLNTDVYPVSFLPVDLLARDVLLVGGIALGMCVVAAIYPARRAAGLAPAVILSQDR